MEKLITNTGKIMRKIKQMSYHNYWDENNLYGRPMSQMLAGNNFKCVGNTSQFNERYIKNYNDENDEGYFLELDFQYSENLLNFHSDLLLLTERVKIEKKKMKNL